MKTLLIILAVVAVVAITAILVLRHPAFGRRMSAERKARIDASSNYRDGMFQNEEPTPQFSRSMPAMLWDFITKPLKQLEPLLHEGDRQMRPPYDGAKPHYVITDVDDRDYVSLIVKIAADSLPAKRK